MAQAKKAPAQKGANNKNVKGVFKPEKAQPDTENDNFFDMEKYVKSPFFEQPKQHVQNSNDFFTSYLNIGSTFQEASFKFMEHPEVFLKSAEKLMQDNLELWQYSLARIQSADQNIKPIIEPSQQDRRFRDPLWGEHPTFDYIKQSYLLLANWADSLAEMTPDLNEATKMKLRFYSRQLIDALSPSNFPFANPTVFKKVIETHGENLFKGYTRFLEDLNQGTGLANIENTDRYAFKIGQDLATTPGKVIFQNNVLQLIQYTPTMGKVFKTPLLIIPAWINKYYILDLRQDNSFVKWLLDQGHAVFMVSWVNPGRKQLNLTFEDYLKEGALKALQVVQEITGEKQINLVGYCLGGILSAVMLGYLQQEASQSLKTLSLLASPLDYSQAGDLLLFTDKQFYDLLCQKMEERGMLDGSVMGATFNMLRANDLIWSAFINNYLLANELPQFDMLFWNADVTNLPAKMFKTYIKEFFQNNNLLRPGAMKMLGQG